MLVGTTLGASLLVTATSQRGWAFTLAHDGALSPKEQETIRAGQDF